MKKQMVLVVMVLLFMAEGCSKRTMDSTETTELVAGMQEAEEWGQETSEREISEKTADWESGRTSGTEAMETETEAMGAETKGQGLPDSTWRGRGGIPRSIIFMSHGEPGCSAGMRIRLTWATGLCLFFWRRKVPIPMR